MIFSIYRDITDFITSDMNLKIRFINITPYISNQIENFLEISTKTK